LLFCRPAGGSYVRDPLATGSRLLILPKLGPRYPWCDPKRGGFYEWHGTPPVGNSAEAQLTAPWPTVRAATLAILGAVLIAPNALTQTPREPVQVRPADRAPPARATTPAPSAPAVDGGTRFAVNRNDCQQAVEYRPAPGVEYQPGVDVRGRPVRPADVESTPRLNLPNELTFNLTVRLSDYLARTPRGLSDSVAPIGKLTVRGNQVLFNDEPLSPRDREAVIAACREALSRRP